MPDDSILDRLAAEDYARRLREEAIFDAIAKGQVDGKVVTFKRYEEPMPDESPLTSDDIRAVADAIRAGEVCYESGDWLVTIGPHHLETPAARGALWQMIARLVELEQQEKDR
jgi:hypothetical protein